ncbi:COX15/CtaA family [Lactarius hengduanensis]|nr:COX15/CtaA family [Lactarius hengduanensis]
MFAAALTVTADWRFARDGTWGRLRNGYARRDRYGAVQVTVLVFLATFSGAFVAGLDAGLIYNEIPLMDGRLALPLDKLLSPSYADASDESKDTWLNLFENPTTVQFDHRVLATTTTYLATALLFVSTRRAAMHAALAGIVALLSPVFHVLLALRRPGVAARAWRQANGP